VPSRKKKSNGPFFERKEIVMIIETDSKKVQCDIFPRTKVVLSAFEDRSDNCDLECVRERPEGLAHITKKSWCSSISKNTTSTRMKHFIQIIIKYARKEKGFSFL
jgi:hypothetical protein